MGVTKLLSFLIFSGFSLLIQLGIVIFAVIAAKRQKLRGLWILAGGTIIGSLQAIVNLLISPSLNLVDHDTAMKYRLVVAGYLYFTTMLILLVGWCVLAFHHKK